MRLLPLLLVFVPTLLPAGEDNSAWKGGPVVLRASAADTVSGTVFEDLDRDSERDPGEPGVPGVLVSNGLAVVPTGEDGSYFLPIRPDMNLTIVKPAGWCTPLDDRKVPAFFHIHKEGGSPGGLRFGGLEPAEGVPAEVHFPLARVPEGAEERFRVAVLGDSQAYSNEEVGYFRDSAVADLLALEDGPPDLLLYVGDVVGDDLGLLPRLLEVASVVGAPQYLVPGNHDIDFDALAAPDSKDSWRRLYGPEYFAFEVGDVLFVVLDNVEYPSPAYPWKTYRGVVSDVQMRWLANLLDHVPADKIVVLAHHIPLVSFVDATQDRHQTSNAADLYRLLEGRPALSLSGHTHTIENHAPGQFFAGWKEHAGVDRLPFRHLIAGAVSGSWFQGDFNHRGVPMALQRMGAPRGVLLLDFEGADYRERYLPLGLNPGQEMWVSLNTPAFRNWFEVITAWADEKPSVRDPVPPLSVNDLPDPRILTPDDLLTGVYLTANVWAGSAETTVVATLGDRGPFTLERTQAGEGEEARIGAEWADPFAAERQLSVARFAFQSRSGDERAQGYEAFKGRRFGPAAPQPMGAVSDRNMHLWRYRLPADLMPGTHVAEITATDRHGREAREVLVFEVREERPPARWRREVWE